MIVQNAVDRFKRVFMQFSLCDADGKRLRAAQFGRVKFRP
jgi:hypothetical protein